MEPSRRALAQPALRDRFAHLSTVPWPLEAGPLTVQIRLDNVRWEAPLHLAGIEPE